jgi:FAD/FMN-containing dehydrogenase
LPANPTYYAPGRTCFQGSIAGYYIDVRQISDIQAGLKFADDTGIPLVVKNSGHDFKGRSSAPGSLALWTHNVQPAIKLDRGFTPDGCSAPAGDAVTLGAGQGFAGVYEFAEANNITVVGGSSHTVGPVGGWISGGGHSALSNTLGLGVDNVLQMKTVLPNGTVITANRCQNQDIFYALRGGGGPAFGVNWEMSTRAHPQVRIMENKVAQLLTRPF